MIKKIIAYVSFFFLLFFNIIISFNVKNYFLVLEQCFQRTITLTSRIYALILTIMAIISILIYIVILFLIFKNKEAQKGIKIKLEDGTYGTANWLNNDEASRILGLNNEPGILLGKSNEKDVVLPFNSYFNKNVLVVGSSRQHEINRIYFT